MNWKLKKKFYKKLTKGLTEKLHKLSDKEILFEEQIL